MGHFSPLLPQFGFSSSVFFRGEFCGATDFLAAAGYGQIHVIRGGRVIMHHPDRESIEVDTPTLMFYPRPLDHRLVVPPGSKADLLCANVTFRRSANNPVSSALPDVMQVPLAGLKGLESTLTLMLEENAGEDDLGKAFVLDHLCDVLVIHVIRYAHAAGLVKLGTLAGLADARLALALEAVHDDPGRPWPVAEMARHAGMSRSAFISRFREVVGTSPAEYVLNWRLDLAERHLEEGRSVKDVARTVGYANQPAFTRAFAARRGIPPTEWLRRCLKAPQDGPAQQNGQTQAD